MSKSQEQANHTLKETHTHENLESSDKPLLIPHPVGYIELSEEELDQVAGMSNRDCPPKSNNN
ncbi:hypothetical protein [Leptothoe spongobia]|uniref:Uncharacterized protein n=1 Tax=Leptothoe spongobia TAU-MAC 1115 TaxID=1967444 RepID=A0A947DGZ7_9CYAN|nr:hypothetical protein [Leptothoe spongobia]MBT9316898.1 hypothetical protein [Leptothoe spongobia TAU-MAC 1115]